MTAMALRTVVFLLATAAVGCSKRVSGDGAQESVSPLGVLRGGISIDGSSTVFPLSRAVADAFRQQHPDVQASVGESGTGGGFRRFCAGQVDVAGASRPINATESAQCAAQHIEYIELPVAFDSIAVVVNPKNDFATCLTVKELKAIWEPAAEGKTTQWQQVRASFPAQPLTLFGPGRDSGTFDYFSLAIVGAESSSRDDFTKSEDDMVIERGVAADSHALGYFGYGYYAANKAQLKLVAVDNGHGCVLPSAEAVADGSYQPLTRPLFLYVNISAAQRPEVRAFTRFYLAPESAQYVAKIGYVPLPRAAQLARETRFETGTKGSVLGAHGSVVGVALDAFDDEDKDRVRSSLVQ